MAMPPLKPSQLSRYRDIAWLLVKYGRAELVESSGLKELIGETKKFVGHEEKKREEGDEPKDHAEEFVRDLEALGPTFVKLGQIMSSRSDLLPRNYIEALSRLQDDVEPFAYSDVEQVIREELGMEIATAYKAFDRDPLAAASLGQVHRATTLDGQDVVVKVQRPGVRKKMRDDLEVLAGVARMLEEHTDIGRHHRLGEIVAQFKRALNQELDYEREMENLVRLREHLQEFDRLIVPKPIEPLCAERVLTMEFIKGRKVTKLDEDQRAEFDGPGLAEELFHAYLKQVLEKGFFHADPHPGNILLTPDNRLGVIDLGMVGRVSPGMQEQLFHLLIAVAEGKAEDAVRAARRIGTPDEGHDAKEFRRRVRELVTERIQGTVSELQIGPMVQDINRIAGETRMSMPAEIRLLSKMLMHLDQVGKCLAPDFDPNASIRSHTSSLMQRRMFKMLAPNNLIPMAVELKQFAERLPDRIEQVLDAAADNHLKIRVDAIDEDRLLRGFKNVANRITVGLVLGALIVGAALMMQVETTFTIMGYPGIAMICFSFAAVLGFVLVLDVMFSDRNDRKRDRHNRR